MRIVIGKDSYKNFISARVNTKMTSIAREFEFVATSRGASDIPFRAGQTCQIFDGEDQLVNGFIERITLKSGEKGNTYSLSGRNLLADLIDSNVPVVYDFASTVSGACRFILAELGIRVQVIDAANTDARPFKSGFSILSPDPDDTAFEFLARTARRKQALLTSDGASNLVITTGVGSKVDAELINRIDGKDNNLLETELTIDHSQRFGRYVTDLQMNMAAQGRSGRDLIASEIVDAGGAISDTEIRPTRVKTTPADYQLDPADAFLRALWEANLATAESIRYKVTVPGFRDSGGNLWKLNTAPIVEDQFTGIDGKMLISEIEYSISSDEGRTTRMVLTDRNSFKAELRIRREIEIDGIDETPG